MPSSSQANSILIKLNAITFREMIILIACRIVLQSSNKLLNNIYDLFQRYGGDCDQSLVWPARYIKKVFYEFIQGNGAVTAVAEPCQIFKAVRAVVGKKGH